MYEREPVGERQQFREQSRIHAIERQCKIGGGKRRAVIERSWSGDIRSFIENSRKRHNRDFGRQVYVREINMRGWRSQALRRFLIRIFCIVFVLFLLPSFCFVLYGFGWTRLLHSSADSEAILVHGLEKKSRPLRRSCTTLHESFCTIFFSGFSAKVLFCHFERVHD